MINLKNNKGITLVTLVITVIVLTIITGVTINGVTTSNEASRYNKMNADIKLLKDKILVYYNKYNEIPITNREITINDIQYKEIDLSKLDSITLNYGKDYGKEDGLIDDESDVYVINDDMNIYYLKGVKMDGQKEHYLENDVSTNKSKSRLPQGYTEVEYLESTGTQYIDTEVVGNLNTHIYIKFKVLRYDSNGYSSICGNYNSANNSITLYVGQNNANYVIRFGSYNRQYFPIGETNKDYIIEYNKNIITINEETYNVGANNTFSTNGSLYIFGRNVNGSLGTGALIGRIYYFRIYEDEKKVGDLIPCLDSDGRKCMYDTVSGTPLYNQGTGDFTAGPEV